MAQCVFCRQIARGDIVIDSPEAVVLADSYPVSAGHMLVVPRAHIASIFQLDKAIYDRVWALVQTARDHVCARLAPDAFNIGINVGTAAGQSVPHAHVHVIPRYAGDVADPRGGVRWVIPERADYSRDHLSADPQG